MTDARDPNTSADLAAYSVMRAVLRSRTEGTEAVPPDIEQIVEDLERCFGRGAVVTLIGSLGLRALWPIEEHAERAGTTAAAELDADEQRVLAMLDRDRADEE